MYVQFGLNGSELRSQKFLRGPNCELELTTSARTETRTVTELSVQFWQFSPNPISQAVLDSFRVNFIPSCRKSSPNTYGFCLQRGMGYGLLRLYGL